MNRWGESINVATLDTEHNIPRENAQGIKSNLS